MEYIAELELAIQSWGVEGKFLYLMVRLSLFLAVVVASSVAHQVARQFFLTFLHRFLKRTSAIWDDALVHSGVFVWLVRIVPAVVFHRGSEIVFPESKRVVEWMHTIVEAYIVILVCVTGFRLLDAGLEVYNRFSIARERPIKAYLQVLKILITVVGVIFIVSTLINSSPWGLLSGLGAVTAVVSLVFRDSILGFVASIQLVANNMVRSGDWIEMPRYNADGEVIDVSLVTVKVQNWDKTITTIPTYALVSDSFKNWRGMSESGGRRIKRSLNIDMQSVQFCSDELLDRFKRIQLLRPYIEKKIDELAEYNQKNSIDESVLVNGRRLTNIGCFRAYVEAYLWNNPRIHQEMTLLVRQLQPGEMGIPIEIYAFSNEQAWSNFEAIQADIFDHLLATIPEFDLRVFQSPGGGDIRAALSRVALD